jgi:hypothetical protein
MAKSGLLRSTIVTPAKEMDRLEHRVSMFLVKGLATLKLETSRAPHRR